MNAVIEKPTLTELRAEAQRLGITEEFTGGALEELLRVARDSDDPLGYLAIHAPPAAASPIDTAIHAEFRAAAAETATETADSIEEPETEPIGDVPAPLPPLMASIEVPLTATILDGCYISTHVEVRMSREQGLTLRRLHLALDAQGARLANGHRVIHAPDAVKWLLEQLAEN